MLGKRYENANTQVEYEETLNPDAHTNFCQEFTKETSDAAAVIMTK